MSATARDIVFRRTPKGEDLVPLVKLLMQFDKTRSKRERRRLVPQIVAANERFSKRWNEDGLALVSRVFSL